MALEFNPSNLVGRAGHELLFPEGISQAPSRPIPYDPNRLYDQPLVEITQSSITTFMACPQRFAFRYLMHLRRRGLSIALVVGSAVHKGLEILLDPASSIPMGERLGAVHLAIDQYFDYTLESRSAECIGIEDKLEHGRAQAHALLDAWWIINGDVLTGWRVIHKELKVRSTAKTHLDPLFTRMAGMIDGLIQDPQEQVWILEHKTRRSLTDLNVNTLELDPQALWYIILCYYVANWDHLSTTGPLHPQGFLYDAMAKPQHRMNANGYQDLRQRMVSAIINDPSKYLHIEPILIEPATVARALDNFKRIIRQMDALSPETVYMNLKACDDYGGCPYKPLCHNRADAAKPAQVLQMPTIEMFDIVPPHEELDDPSQEEEKWSPR